MIKIYSSYNLDVIRKLIDEEKVLINIFFPEKDKSPWEQIDWIEAHYKDDISIFTFSPYILNAMNLIIAKNDLKSDDLFAVYIDHTGDETDLVVKDKFNNPLLDTSWLSEPISWIYQEYNSIRKTE